MDWQRNLAPGLVGRACRTRLLDLTSPHRPRIDGISRPKWGFHFGEALYEMRIWQLYDEIIIVIRHVVTCHAVDGHVQDTGGIAVAG